MEITIKPMTEDILEETSELYYNETGQKLSIDKIRSHIEGKYPCMVACYENKVVGFVISGSFAPDILEIRNIFISQDMRGRKIGSELLKEFEGKASDRAQAIILVNSKLYSSIPGKRNPEKFYINNGYKIVHRTSETSVFIKSLE